MAGGYASKPNDFISRFSMKTRLKFRPIGAILGPLNFSLRTGHFRSAIAQKCMDAKGRPLPYYTYPAIRYLSEIDFSECDILEFGGGQSTFWWDERSKSVLTLEEDEAWSNYVAIGVTQKTKVVYTTSPYHSRSTVRDRRFDVAIVDAGSGDQVNGREINMKTAIEVVRETGLIVVDNSNAGYSGDVGGIGSRAGFRRIDFIGFSGGTIREYCTSIFLKPQTCRLWPYANPMAYI